MRIRLRYLAVPLALATQFAFGVARADFEPLIRIGDKDGFGYGAATGFQAAKHGFANRDGLGILSDGDFLPDINNDGSLMYGSHDDFDFRSSAELAGGSIFHGSGVTNTGGTTGSQWTDMALSRSYDVSSARGQVLIGGDPISGLQYGSGGSFPDGSSSTPNQPSFVFRFDVAKSELTPATGIYFNLIFGDYDVTPASIKLTLADNSTRTISLRTQGSMQDGLIQAAQADLGFADVFRDGGSVWNGSLKVDFIAPNEPYTSFDFVELSTFPILPVPEPSTILMLGIGLGGLGLAVRGQASRIRRRGL